MTQAPIEPHHKDMAAKAAGYEQPELVIRGIENGHSPIVPATVASILAHAQDIANLEKAQADLAEINRIALLHGWTPSNKGKISEPASLIAAIAAPYRASDPVAESLKDVLIALGVGPDECVASKWNAGVAKFRAFIEGDR